MKRSLGVLAAAVLLSIGLVIAACGLPADDRPAYCVDDDDD